MTLPLAGIKIVDFSEHGFVPSGAAALGDWGADVVKIERLEGDPMRSVIRNGLSPAADGVDYLFEMANRNKRGIALDVTTPAGREVFERLVKWADVYITNQLPRVRRKLHTEPADLFALNPKLVFAKGHGQGQRGADAEAGGFDSVSFWSRGGMGHILTEPDAPTARRCSAPRMGDVPSGMFLAGGICAGLVHVLRTGEGTVVDMSLLNAAMWTLGPDMAYSSITGNEMPRMQVGKGTMSPLVGVLRTKDSRWLMLSMLDEDALLGADVPRARAARAHRALPRRRRTPAALARAHADVRRADREPHPRRARTAAARRGLHLLVLRVAARSARRSGGRRERLRDGAPDASERAPRRPRPCSSTTSSRPCGGAGPSGASTRPRCWPSSATTRARSTRSSPTGWSTVHARREPRRRAGGRGHDPRLRSSRRRRCPPARSRRSPAPSSG